MKCSFVSKDVNLFEHKSFEDLRLDEALTCDQEIQCNIATICMDACVETDNGCSFGDDPAEVRNQEV